MAINGVSGTSPVTQFHQAVQSPNAQTHKNSQNDNEPVDTVVLSKKATESQSADKDHDGDSH